MKIPVSLHLPQSICITEKFIFPSVSYKIQKYSAYAFYGKYSGIYSLSPRLFVIDIYSMYIIASLFFAAGIAAGAIYGFTVEKTGMDIILFTIAGGFAGSAAGGIIFTYLYLTGHNDYDNDEYETNNENKYTGHETGPDNLFIPEFFKIKSIKKLSAKKDNTGTYGTGQTYKETDKQKIKRLKKEIKKLKKQKAKKL